MIEFRYWQKEQARDRYESLVKSGARCNMSADGKGVILRIKL